MTFSQEAAAERFVLNTRSTEYTAAELRSEREALRQNDAARAVRHATLLTVKANIFAEMRSWDAKEKFWSAMWGSASGPRRTGRAHVGGHALNLAGASNRVANHRDKNPEEVVSDRPGPLRGMVAPRGRGCPPWPPPHERVGWS